MITCETCKRTEEDVQLEIVPCCKRVVCFDFCLYDASDQCPACEASISIKTTPEGDLDITPRTRATYEISVPLADAEEAEELLRIALAVGKDWRLSRVDKARSSDLVDDQLEDDDFWL